VRRDRLDRVRIEAAHLEEKLDKLADELELDVDPCCLDAYDKLEEELDRLAQRASYIRASLDRAMDE
jgi:predicted nuclease with TOPRIM domain